MAIVRQYALRHQDRAIAEGALPVAVCQACARALLREIDALFVPYRPSPLHTLEHSTIMGLTFQLVSDDACVLCPLVWQED